MSDVRDLFERLTDIEPASSASAVLERAEARARRLARSRKQRTFAAVGVVAALIVSAVVIAAGAGGGRGSRLPVAATTTTTTTPVPVSYEVDTEVEQGPSGDPVLCLGPQLATTGLLCGGVPIANWNWANVTGAKTAYGFTTGSYHLVGTYDGTVFTVTEKPGPSRPVPRARHDFAPPCPTPAGGWVDVDPSRLTQADYDKFVNAMQQPPDAAGWWVSSGIPVGGVLSDNPAQEVTIVAFTRNIDAHRAQLRSLWGGPVCVVEHKHSTEELERVARSLNGPDSLQLDLGIRYGGGPDPVNDNVFFDVVVATPAMQQAVDRKYGAGVVELRGALTPVASP
jgi:hypothetical protein